MGDLNVSIKDVEVLSQLQSSLSGHSQQIEFDTHRIKNEANEIRTNIYNTYHSIEGLLDRLKYKLSVAEDALRSCEYTFSEEIAKGETHCAREAREVNELRERVRKLEADFPRCQRLNFQAADETQEVESQSNRISSKVKENASSARSKLSELGEHIKNYLKLKTI